MRLLDLFCGAGGAAKGYQDAGFYVVGVDLVDQPNYCGDEFIQTDALSVTPNGYNSKGMAWPPGYFDLVHASPPCQHYAAVTRWRGSAGNHPDLVGPTRQLLEASGLPYVIENVREADLQNPTMLCGSQFDIKVRRHRYFETNWLPFQMMQPCLHGGLLPFMHKQERAYADAMGCTWMSSVEAREAIPPAYSRFIGEQFISDRFIAGYPQGGR